MIFVEDFTCKLCLEIYVTTRKDYAISNVQVCKLTKVTT